MKQAEDNKTIDAFKLPIISKLRQIERQIREKAERIADLKGQISHLEQLGTINASLHYKAGKYLYLIHPTQENGERVRQYVGAQPEKIKEAEKAITRYNTVEMLKGLVKTHQSKLDYAEWKLKETIEALNRQW